MLSETRCTAGNECIHQGQEYQDSDNGSPENNAAIVNVIIDPRRSESVQ